MQKSFLILTLVPLLLNSQTSNGQGFVITNPKKLERSITVGGDK